MNIRFKDIHDSLLEDHGLSRQEVKSFYVWCANKDKLRVDTAKELFINAVGGSISTVTIEDASRYAEKSLNLADIFLDKLKEGT